MDYYYQEEPEEEDYIFYKFKRVDFEYRKSQWGMIRRCRPVRRAGPTQLPRTMNQHSYKSNHEDTKRRKIKIKVHMKPDGSSTSAGASGPPSAQPQGHGVASAGEGRKLNSSFSSRRRSVKYVATREQEDSIVKQLGLKVEKNKHNPKWEENKKRLSLMWWYCDNKITYGDYCC